MGDPIQRRGEWWQQQPDGSWLRWDEPSARWQPQEFPPPPPENAETIMQAWAAPPRGGVAQSVQAPADPMAPTPGYKYARGEDGTWWARSEATGELHWHDVASGQWRRYIDPNARAADAPLEGVEYAGFWRRAGAALIDSILLGGLSGLLSWASLMAARESVASTAEETAAIAVTIQLVSAVLVWLYDALMESSSRQATLGKMALGLRVTDMQGNRIGFRKATGRHFGKYLSALILGIGFLMVAWTRQKQGLHDQMAGTLVLKARTQGASTAPEPATS